MPCLFCLGSRVASNSCATDCKFAAMVAALWKGTKPRGKESVVSVAIKRAESRDDGDALTFIRNGRDVRGNTFSRKAVGR